MNSVPPNNQGKQPGFTFEAADNSLSAPKNEDLSASPSCPEQMDGPEGTPIEERATSVRSDVQRTETASPSQTDSDDHSSQTDKSAPTSEEHDPSWLAWAKKQTSYWFSLLWGTEKNEQSSQNITAERFEALADDNSEVDEEFEEINDTDIAEIAGTVRDSAINNLNPAIQRLPEPWHKVFEHYLTDHDDTAPEFLSDQTCQELFEHYSPNKKTTPYGAINHDKEELINALSIIKDFWPSTIGTPFYDNLLELYKDIIKINRRVDDAMNLQDRCQSFSKKQQEVSPSSSKSQFFSKTMLVPVHKLEPDEHHIDNQFNADINRNMDVTAYSPDGQLEFRIKTNHKGYQVFDTKKNTDEPSATGKLEEVFSCEVFEDSKAIKIDPAKKYGKKSELRAAGKEAVARFAVQSASRVKQWFPSDMSTAEMESYGVEWHSNPLTTVMSDLASQTCGNSMHAFLSHIIQRDDYALMPIDMEYRTEFHAQYDGSVIAKLHAEFPFIELRNLKSPLQSIKVDQSVTIETEVNLIPEELNTRRFERCTARFGDLKSIAIETIDPKLPESFE